MFNPSPRFWFTLYRTSPDFWLHPRFQPFSKQHIKGWFSLKSIHNYHPVKFGILKMTLFSGRQSHPLTFMKVKFQTIASPTHHIKHYFLSVQLIDFEIKVINFISCEYSPDQILKIKLRLLQTYFREKAIFQFCPQQHRGRNNWIYLFIFHSAPPMRGHCCLKVWVEQQSFMHVILLKWHFGIPHP